MPLFGDRRSRLLAGTPAIDGIQGVRENSVCRISLQYKADSVNFLILVFFASSTAGDIINPLAPTAQESTQIAKISILKLEGIMKKNPMSVAIEYES